jgi:hypothetical protein
MEPDLKWIIGSLIEQIRYDDQVQRWVFMISGRVILYLNCPWKVILGETVSLASGDHGQQYGLTSSIDAVAKATNLLVGHKIRSFIPDKVTSDLEIIFETGAILRTFNESSGFEAWHLVGPRGTDFIAQGNGKIIVLSQQGGK